MPVHEWHDSTFYTIRYRTCTAQQFVEEWYRKNTVWSHVAQCNCLYRSGNITIACIRVTHDNNLRRSGTLVTKTVLATYINEILSKGGM